MSNLRIATLDDVDIVLAFAKQLCSELPYNPTIWNTHKWHKIAKEVISGDRNKNIVILAYATQVGQDQTPIGVLGCAVSQPLFCQEEETMAVELLLYIEPEHRGTTVVLELLRAYKYWAKLVGCTYISYASYKNKVEQNRIKRIKY